MFFFFWIHFQKNTPVFKIQLFHLKPFWKTCWMSSLYEKIRYFITFVVACICFIQKYRMLRFQDYCMRSFRNRENIFVYVFHLQFCFLFLFSYSHIWSIYDIYFMYSFIYLQSYTTYSIPLYQDVLVYCIWRNTMNSVGNLK